MRQPKQGLAGYLSYVPAANPRAASEAAAAWHANTSFLTGVTGIARAPLGGVSGVTPGWDGLLLTRL